MADLLFYRSGDSRTNDGLSVDPHADGSGLRFATDHEAHSLDRSDVRALRDALTEWLGDRIPCDVTFTMVADEPREPIVATLTELGRSTASFGPSDDGQTFGRKKREE